ncbi:MAG: hypothetical protein CXB60_05165 [Spiroplasma poulsonii]|nr:hypothetical protein [Spiroplasma poulsonii]
MKKIAKFVMEQGITLKMILIIFVRLVVVLVGMKNKKIIVFYLPSLSKPKQKVTIHRVGHAGYAGGERGAFG